MLILIEREDRQMTKVNFYEVEVKYTGRFEDYEIIKAEILNRMNKEEI